MILHDLFELLPLASYVTNENPHTNKVYQNNVYEARRLRVLSLIVIT